MRFAAVLCLLVVAGMVSCAKTARMNSAASNEPEMLVVNLAGAHEGWPMDTANGLYAVGLSTPADSSMTPEKQEGQAKAGALVRIFAQLRQKGIGTAKAELDFFICAEENAREAYVRTSRLPNTRMEVGVFFNQQTVKALEQCLSR